MLNNFMATTRREYWEAKGAYERAELDHGADSAEAKALKPRMDEAQRNLPEGSVDAIRNK